MSTLIMNTTHLMVPSAIDHEHHPPYGSISHWSWTPTTLWFHQPFIMNTTHLMVPSAIDHGHHPPYGAISHWSWTPPTLWFDHGHHPPYGSISHWSWTPPTLWFHQHKSIFSLLGAWRSSGINLHVGQVFRGVPRIFWGGAVITDLVRATPSYTLPTLSEIYQVTPLPHRHNT